MIVFEKSGGEKSIGKIVIGKAPSQMGKFAWVWNPKNIDKTVALYDGYCSRTIENGVFSCQIRMQNRKIKLMEVENVLEFIVHCNLCQIRIHSCLNQKENK